MFRVYLISKPLVRRLHVKEELLLQDCRTKLRVSEHCTASELREAFISLARKYHPDSGSAEASATIFTDIENAYRTLRAKILATNKNEENEEESGFKYTAPQHRQYLNYEGIGSGTPSQRQRQYQSYKLDRAVNLVAEHTIKQINAQDDQSLLAKDKLAAKRHKISNAIERLVEDLIQESMSKGEFENLPGKGKPLKGGNYNPYLDDTSHKLNQVLINNGFIPQWALLQKDICRIINNIRQQLEDQRRQLGPWPLGREDEKKWARVMEQHQSSFKDLNLQVDKYNLVVPFLHKQMAHFQLKRESDRILLTVLPANKNDPEPREDEIPKGLKGIINSVFVKLK